MRADRGVNTGKTSKRNRMTAWSFFKVADRVKCLAFTNEVTLRLMLEARFSTMRTTSVEPEQFSDSCRTPSEMNSSLEARP